MLILLHQINFHTNYFKTLIRIAIRSMGYYIDRI